MAAQMVKRVIITLLVLSGTYMIGNEAT